jgi:hypothetical protein
MSMRVRKAGANDFDVIYIKSGSVYTPLNPAPQSSQSPNFLRFKASFTTNICLYTMRCILDWPKDVLMFW